MTQRRLMVLFGLTGLCVGFVACGRNGLYAKSIRDGSVGETGRGDVGGPGAKPDAMTGKDAVVVIPPDTQLSTCGNGIVDPSEACDDGNTLSGDGCSSLCKIECDFTCSCGDPTKICKSIAVCGDGLKFSSEGCDDGNTNDGDGCSANCQIEPHWVCPLPGRRCTPMCGDGVLVGTETCDDGNTVAGDGCGENCLIEGGGLSCGDGVTSGAEECDDGALNNVSTYGACTSRCKYSRCGDGIVNGPEECDLGDARNNAVYGDPEGCTSACIHPHYCGDGFIDADYGEMCDLGTIGNRAGSYCTPICVVWLP